MAGGRTSRRSTGGVGCPFGRQRRDSGGDTGQIWLRALTALANTQVRKGRIWVAAKPAAGRLLGCPSTNCPQLHGRPQAPSPLPSEGTERNNISPKLVPRYPLVL